VHAFLAQASQENATHAVEGSVVYSGSNDRRYGGTYDVEFTPTIAGDYTIAVMLGTQLEVQNITTNWGSLATRSIFYSFSW